MDWYYTLTLFPCMGSIIAASSLIFIPWYSKDPDPRIPLIKSQAIADIIFAFANILIFVHSMPCAIPIVLTKWAKCFSLLSAVSLSLMHTNIFRLKPQAFAAVGLRLTFMVIALFSGVFSLFPFNKEIFYPDNCVNIINLPKNIGSLLAGDVLVAVAVVITLIAVCFNHCKARSESQITKGPLILVGIWIIDFVVTVIHFNSDVEFTLSMSPKLFFTRCIGIANFWIYRKTVISLSNPKQGLEKGLECIGLREYDEALLIKNQVERFNCEIHGFALLHMASHLEEESLCREGYEKLRKECDEELRKECDEELRKECDEEPRKECYEELRKQGYEELRKQGYEILRKSLDKKYYDDLIPEKPNDAGKRQTIHKNEKVQQNNQEKTQRDRERSDKEREINNGRREKLQKARAKLETHSPEDINEAISLLEDVGGNDSLSLLAHQLHGVALCFSKNYGKALEEFKKSFEGSQEEPKPEKDEKENKKEKIQSSFAPSQVDDLTRPLNDERDSTMNRL